MLELKNISKQYKTGELVQKALENVGICFRENEFVSVLGPSGSGKTTLLNIIGGLDRYDSGNLMINGRSTKEYKDRDWDTYRNHTIGFVFQSYNLIAHQTILSNVELALTIGGVSGTERRARARAALAEVGLAGQEHKRPNQLSGGQMQRVAIARALVNDPDILLADEPTGALDSETSLQVMELLKQLAEKRLVIMVTHNGELAERYSTRIVRLRDGRIVGDTDPYTPENKTAPEAAPRKRAGMSFLTALALSAQNLRTKKGRTLLTAFAGSIGIIGIALILALSSGVNNYIAEIQRDTMTSYPITINSEDMDISGLMGQSSFMSFGKEEAKTAEPGSGIRVDYSDMVSTEAITSSVTRNDLTAFRQYLEDPESEIRSFVGEAGIVYAYDVSFTVFTRDSRGALLNTDADADELTGSRSGMGGRAIDARDMYSSFGSSGAGDSAGNFSELMPGSDGAAVSRVVTDNYELLAGVWPERFDELVLVLNSDNSLPAETLYQLGVLSAEAYKTAGEAIKNGGEAEALRFDYTELLGRTYQLVPACDRYRDRGDGTFARTDDSLAEQAGLLDNAVELKIVGVVRPTENAAYTGISTALAYPAALTDYVIGRTNESAVVLAQEAAPERNVLTGLRFEAQDDAQKEEDAKTYIRTLGVSDKARLYLRIRNPAQQGSNEGGSPEETAAMSETEQAEALDAWVSGEPDRETLISIYDQYVAGSSYAANLAAFGKISYDAPASISIYADSFEDKEAIAECIARYNETAGDAKKISYTDYIALITSSITSIVNVISYVLIAFVAVSLVVSCIMIGIITHISVLERTKEIGILRAIGASKGNISQVFNAETVIIGLCSGLLGVGITMLLTIPINALLRALTGSDTVSAALPVGSALILILISVAVTVIGGLIPARKAANKDPVIALRTE